MVVRVFCPAAISSFFAPYIVEDPLKCGAWGGGFTIDRGVYVEVEVEANAENIELRNIINGVEVDSCILRIIYDLMVPSELKPCKVIVKQRIEVPIECGFGSSGASALAISLALAKALKLKMTYLQIARIAHLADYYCRTGLGTVAGIVGGGFRLAVKPGAPGIAIVDRIPINEDEYRVIAATFGPISTREVLGETRKLEYFTELGKEALKNILKEPTPENFMKQCRIFALKSGFMTNRIRGIIENTMNNGLTNITQNMIGEAVHALVHVSEIDKALSIFKKHFNEENIIVAQIDSRGPRYIST